MPATPALAVPDRWAAGARTVALVTLGCVRNEVDSEELAGRLAAAGWQLVDDAAEADVAVVNTCGFVEQAKKDSVDALLEASDLKDGAARTRAVVAVGCMAERYGVELAAQLPEADAVLGFDSYADLSGHLDAVLAGRPPASHVPRDRRTLLPVSPTDRPARADRVALPGHDHPPPSQSPPSHSEPSHSEPSQSPPSHSEPSHPAPSRPPTPLAGPLAEDAPAGAYPASGPRVVRRRLDGRPWAPLKLASGCDRRCSFCAIPMFRGSFLSRRPADVLEEARWLAATGARELFLVSENSTSYGKDLGDIRLLETLLPELAALDGVDRVRVSYLQPAEVRPGLLEVIGGTPGVAAYFDLSFQHSAPSVLRRMRRFGDTEAFLGLVRRVRDLAPRAGIRSNVIVGFPGETEEDLAELHDFLERAELDVVGVFAYSDEDGTEAEHLDGKVDPDEVAARLRLTHDLVTELMDQRAAGRVGELVEVLVEELEDGAAVGRGEHQGPDVDGVTTLTSPAAVGELVTAEVTGSEGPDLLARTVSG